MIPEGLKPYFKGLAILGALLMAGDTWLSAKFGYLISWEMGIVYAAISIASGMLLVIAWYFHRLGVKPLARGLTAAWAVAFAFNCWSNMGVSTSSRMGDVQRATVQQATYKGRETKISENEASLKLFNDQLATLLKQNEWAAAVSADGLRGQVATLEKSIREEGGKHNGGCKRRCLDLMAKKEQVEKQIGVAEQRSDLTNRIEATKRTLATLRNDLSTTDAGISSTANQSTLYAKLISWNLAVNPDEAMIVVANEATGIGSAFVLALLATAVTFASAWPHLANVGPLTGTPSATYLHQPPASIARAVAPVPPVMAQAPVVEVVVQQEPAPEPEQPKATTELGFHPVNAVMRKKTTAFAQRCAAIADHHVQRIAMVRSAA
jgi:hypothetical protein